MRKTIANTFLEYAETSNNFVVLTADLGYSVFDTFREKHPDKFYNVGIAENTMVGVAAGLAMTGKKVFTYSIASFLAVKCSEQIRDDVSYHNLPVVLIGTGAGFAYGQAGYTHYANEDLAIMRTIPNLTIISPSDPVELRLLLEKTMDYDKPVYMRVGKGGEQTFTNRSDLAIGQAYFLEEEEEIAIVAHGSIMEEAHKLRELLKGQGKKVSLVSSPTIKPLDYTFFKELRNRHSKIYVVEEHYKTGGLGSALLESGFDVEVFAIPDEYTFEGGTQKYLRTMNRIDAVSMYNEIMKSTH
jgi:transketolase